jgi:hypothetical protein
MNRNQMVWELMTGGGRKGRAVVSQPKTVTTIHLTDQAETALQKIVPLPLVSQFGSRLTGRDSNYFLFQTNGHRLIHKSVNVPHPLTGIS